MRRILQVFLGVAVSAGFLFFALRGVELDRVLALLGGAEPGWVAAAAAVTLYANWVRAQRWGHFFRPGRRIPVASLFSSVMIGQAGNTVLPLRVGEPLRALSLSRKEPLSFTQSFITVLLERLFDLVALALFFAIFAYTTPVPERLGPQMASATALLAGVVVASVAAGVFLVFRRDLLVRAADRLLGVLPERFAAPGRGLLDSLLSGVQALGDPRQVAILLLYSVWLWICFAAVYGLSARALHLDALYGLPIAEVSIAVMVMVAIFIMIPAAPGFVGTFQAGCILALSLFGVAKDEALGYSVLAHALQIAVFTAVGGLCFLREGMTVAEVHRAEEELEGGVSRSPEPPPGSASAR